MKRAFTCIACFAVALIAPVIFFSLTLLNEKIPILPYIVCIPLFGAAGYFSSSPEDRADMSPVVFKWIVWSAVIGLVEAIMLTVGK